MLLIEEEAKTKWCPFARVAKSDAEDHVAYGQAVFNRVETPAGKAGWPEGGRCIASQCMAWRYGPVFYVTADGQQERDGYCGLAGKPKGA